MQGSRQSGRLWRPDGLGLRGPGPENCQGASRISHKISLKVTAALCRLCQSRAPDRQSWGPIFFLGRDHRIENLIHCLGAGQSFKYTPVLGEIVADCITGGAYADDNDEFCIARFDDEYMKDSWQKVSGTERSLEARPLHFERTDRLFEA